MYIYPEDRKMMYGICKDVEENDGGDVFRGSICPWENEFEWEVNNSSITGIASRPIHYQSKKMNHLIESGKTYSLISFFRILNEERTI